MANKNNRPLWNILQVSLALQVCYKRSRKALDFLKKIRSSKRVGAGIVVKREHSCNWYIPWQKVFEPHSPWILMWSGFGWILGSTMNRDYTIQNLVSFAHSGHFMGCFLTQHWPLATGHLLHETWGRAYGVRWDPAASWSVLATITLAALKICMNSCPPNKEFNKDHGLREGWRLLIITEVQPVGCNWNAARNGEGAARRRGHFVGCDFAALAPMHVWAPEPSRIPLPRFGKVADVWKGSKQRRNCF